MWTYAIVIVVFALVAGWAQHRSNETRRKIDQAREEETRAWREREWRREDDARQWEIDRSKREARPHED